MPKPKPKPKPPLSAAAFREKRGRSRDRPVQVYLYESEFSDFGDICARRNRTKSEQLRLWIVAVIAQYRTGKDPRQAGLF